MAEAEGACHRWREALSAIADGEDPAADTRLLDAHLAHCLACRSWNDSVLALRGPLRVQVAPPMDDLSTPVVRQVRQADRAGRSLVGRGLLVVVAVQIAVLAVPSLVADHAGGPGHDARHLGAFSVAYAVGLVVVAVRPARTRTMLPVALVLAGTLVLTAVVDVAGGRVPFGGELVGHLPEALSAGLVWRLAPAAPGRPSDERLLRRLSGRLRHSHPSTSARRSAG